MNKNLTGKMPGLVPAAWTTIYHAVERNVPRVWEFLMVILLCPSEWQYLPAWMLAYRKSPLSIHMPWLPYAVISYLKSLLTVEAVVFEYGGGGSTLWLAERVGSLTTVEHDPRWWAKIGRELQKSAATNCTLLLQSLPMGEVEDFEKYVEVIDQFPDERFDLVIVDGMSGCRPACLQHAASKVRRGGLLVLDDAHRKDYETAMKSLQSWSRRDFHGIRPGALEPGHTTCWTRPV